MREKYLPPGFLLLAAASALFFAPGIGNKTAWTSGPAVSSGTTELKDSDPAQSEPMHAVNTPDPRKSDEDYPGVADNSLARFGIREQLPMSESERKCYEREQPLWMPGISVFEVRLGGFGCLEAFEFAEEPRDPAFAPGMEQSLYDAVANAAAELSLIEIQCRTSSCRVLLVNSVADGTVVDAVMSELEKLADAVDMSASRDLVGANRDTPAMFFRLDSRK